MESAREVVTAILDNESFIELWPNLQTYHILNFANYSEKLDAARAKSGEIESVIAGTGVIDGHKCVIVAIEPMFMMESMGLAAGKKIARAFRFAAKKKLPVITLSASGGAGIQEGIVALMQMAKTSAAVYEHAEKQQLYLSVIRDPTLGGVAASFASLADIIIGEQGAGFGFSGKRIIEETTHEKMPDGFQTVEYAKHFGMVDIVVNQDKLKELLGRILSLDSK